MKEITSKIGEVLAAELNGFKVVKSRSHLLRTTASGWQAIAIHAQPTTTPGVVKFAAHAQVRLDQIEALYVPLHPFISIKEAKLHPTLAINCDQLLGNRSLANGFTAEATSISSFALSYAADVRNNVLPWLEKYSIEDALLEGLSDPDPKKWVTSDRLTRYPVLMAILAKRGDWSNFEQISAEFAAYLRRETCIGLQTTRRVDGADAPVQ